MAAVHVSVTEVCSPSTTPLLAPVGAPSFFKMAGTVYNGVLLTVALPTELLGSGGSQGRI